MRQIRIAVTALPVRVLTVTLKTVIRVQQERSSSAASIRDESLPNHNYQ